MSIRHASILAVLAALLFASPGPAAVLDDLARDFSPVSGVVVQPAEGGFLIDRTAADGIDIGDLFSVVERGEKIVHPVTGKELGTLDRVKGFLQVTRVRPGYSFTRLVVGSAGEIRSGDVIRRYDHVPALFLDRTGKGKAFYDRLRASLPGLDWQFQELGNEGAPPAIPEKILLSFLLGPETLEVRAPHTPVRTYDLARGGAGPPPAATAVVPVPAVPAARATSARMEPAGGRAAADFSVLGPLPDGTRMADFVRDGGRLLLATTDGSRIEVFEVTDKPVLQAIGSPSRGGSILGLHWWRPSPGGPLLLAATLAVEENRAFNPAIGQTIAGRVFALDGRALQPVGDEIPYLLGSFDRDGDGTPETLLGQPFDRDIFFGTRVREIRLKGNDLEIGDGAPFPLPGTFPVQGARFADLTGDGHPETLFIRNRTLFVYEGTKLLYESSRQMGGSLSVMTYDINPGAADRLFTTGPFEIAPAVVDLDGDGQLEVLAPAFEGSSISLGGPDIRKSWLATLDYREGRFVRGTLGPELETPIPGLHATDQGVFVVSTGSPSMLQPKKSSHLLFLPLGGEGNR
ncbi:MAG: hypothetical protein Kow00128_07280 [Deltaproteobacteria bacterium]